MTFAHVVLILAIGAGQTQATPQDERFAALMGLARTKRDAGDNASARKYFEQAAQVRTLGTEDLAEYFWVIGEDDPAVTLRVGRDLLRASPANGDVRDRMITAALRSGDEALIAALAAAGARIAPSSAIWPRRLGESLLRQRQAAKAVEAFAQAAAAPDHVLADVADLAIAQEIAGQWRASLESWAAVPASARLREQSWMESRFRALAAGAPPRDAAAEIAGWIAVHPDDDAWRAQLVELWARAGQPDRALEAIGPLAKGAAANRWLRREADLARAARQPARAIAALDGLAARGGASTGDLIDLASWLIEGEDFDRAGVVIASVERVAGPCDPRVVELDDRLPDPIGTNALLTAARSSSCRLDTPWMLRIIERLEAAARHADALELIEKLPEPASRDARMRALKGELLFWTGHATDAIATLEPLLADVPRDLAARAALVDAYRAIRQPIDAWRTASPFLELSNLDADRLEMLCELALEARQPEAAQRLVDRLAARAIEPSRVARSQSRVQAYLDAEQAERERVAAIARRDAEARAAAAAEAARAAAIDREIAQVRLLADREQWGDAIAGIQALIQKDPAPAHLKLRAEILSWAGRHAEAIAAYDRYLAAVPTDIAALRQQARVAGWANWSGTARKMYAKLLAGPGASEVAAAEAAAKSAFLDGRWRAAVDAYDRWLALEPDNGEAAFERAQALRAAGDIVQADQALDTLATSGGHRLAIAARDRFDLLKRPAFTLIDDTKLADGHDGAQLLDLHRAGGGISGTMGASGQTTWSVNGALVHAWANQQSRTGSWLAGGFSTPVTSYAAVDGSVSTSTIGSGAVAIEGHAGTTWRPADLWTVSATFTRERVSENVATLDANLMGAGPAIRIERQSTHATFGLQASRQALTDDNSRARVTSWFSWIPNERVSGLRGVVWAESLSYRANSASYFSPARFIRVDAGVEMTHYFRRPRFRDDRATSITASYLVGADDRGAWYQHPTVRLSVELSRLVALDVQGHVIQSSTYHERSFTVSLRVLRDDGRQPR